MWQQISSYDIKSTQQQNVAAKTSDARLKIKQINNNAQRVLTISNIIEYPNEVFNPIHEAKPDGITVDKYQIDMELGTITLSGEAETRSDLIEFEQNLENIERFVNVSIPLSTLEIESNINYQISFIYLTKSDLRKK